MIDYTIAEEYADCVHALALVESNENFLSIGDGGQATGLLQMHPVTFRQYYGCSAQRFIPGLTDTWVEAHIKACAAFLDVYSLYAMDLRIQAWNLGLHAVLEAGERNPEYLAKYTEALNRVRGIK